MHDLPWVPFEERTWTYRFQGPVFVDREGYLSSTDLGIGASFVARNRMVEGHLSIVNGETWSQPEVSRNKDVHARLGVRPFVGRGALAGLAVNMFGSTGAYDTTAAQTRSRLIAQLAFEHRFGALAVEYFRAKDPPGRMVARQPSLSSSTDAEVTAGGYSAFGWVDLAAFGRARGVRLMGRVEHLDPDTHLASNGHTRTIVGVGYRANEFVQVLLDGEFVSYEANAAVSRNESRLFLHGSVGF